MSDTTIGCAVCTKVILEPCYCYGTDPRCPACCGTGEQLVPHCCTCNSHPENCQCEDARAPRVAGMTLAQALRRDDALVDNGMDPADRITCFTHRTWREQCAADELHLHEHLDPAVVYGHRPRRR